MRVFWEDRLHIRVGLPGKLALRREEMSALCNRMILAASRWPRGPRRRLVQ